MKQLKLIIDERGKELLNDRVALSEAMREKGCDERDIHTIMLILASCPTVARRLVEAEPTKRELRSMVNSCCALSGLHAKAVRRGLGMLMYGCGYGSGYAPRLTVWCVQGNHMELFPEHEQEDQTVSELIRRVEANPEDAAALSDLSSLANVGNPRAAYFLGCRDMNTGDSNLRMRALQYLTQAKEGGFGPAYGALAKFNMNFGPKHMAKAARYFDHPASLYGKEGRQWKALSQSLLQYRTENKKRLSVAAIWQGVTLAASGVLFGLTGGFGAWAITCMVLQSVALLWTVVCRIFRPYATSRVAYYALMLSWLLLAVCVL